MKKYDAILFDLDGTLLPMDNDLFIKTYLGLLVKKMAPSGYDKDLLVASLWKGTGARIKNDGSKNERRGLLELLCKGIRRPYLCRHRKL